MKRNRREVKFVIIVLLCLIFLFVYDNKGIDSDQEDILLYEQGNLRLYKHHIDRDHHCILINDMALTQEEMDELLRMDVDSRQKNVIKRSNILIRRLYRLKRLSTDSVEVTIRKVPEGEFGANYRAEVTYTNKMVKLNIAANIFVVEPGSAVLPLQAPKNLLPDNPSSEANKTENLHQDGSQINNQKPDMPQSESQQQNDLQSDNQQIETPVQSGSYQDSQPQDDSMLSNPGNLFSIPSSLADWFSESDVESEQVGPAQNNMGTAKRQNSLSTYAFCIATFGASAIIGTMYTNSIMMDIRTLKWHRNKRLKRRGKRK